MMTIEVMVLDSGGGFILKFKRFDVKNGLLVRLKQGEYLSAFLSGMTVINAQITDDLFER